MHKITKYGIVYENDGEGFMYPIFQETARHGLFVRFDREEHILTHSQLKEDISKLKKHYESLGFYSSETNSFQVEDPRMFTSCSLFDIAFTRQDKNNINIAGVELVPTEVSHGLRGAYNHGLVQILTTSTMSPSLIEAAIRKIHSEELISPFLIAQGVCFRKQEAKWTGKNYMIRI